MKYQMFANKIIFWSNMNSQPEKSNRLVYMYYYLAAWSSLCQFLIDGLVQCDGIVGWHTSYYPLKVTNMIKDCVLP